MDKVTCCFLPGCSHCKLYWAQSPAGCWHACSGAKSLLVCDTRTHERECWSTAAVGSLDLVMLPRGREGRAGSNAYSGGTLRLWCYWCTVDSEHEEEAVLGLGLLVSGWSRLAYHWPLSWLDLGLWKESTNEIVCESKMSWVNLQKPSDLWRDTGNTADSGGIFFLTASRCTISVFTTVHRIYSVEGEYCKPV